MPAYNFQKRFASRVRSGIKRQTIRRRRKWPTQVGDMLYLFVGQRTKRCELLRETICKRVWPIDIYPSHIVLNGRQLPVEEARDLICKEGFHSFEEFYTFFKVLYGLPIVGELELIEWA